MKHWVLLLALSGLLLTSLEGAADAVRIAHGDGEAAMHDMHHPQHGDHHGQDGDGGAGSDAHLCHCTAHLPPLAHGVQLTAILGTHYRPVLSPAPRVYLSGPPPLPPPIV